MKVLALKKNERRVLQVLSRSRKNLKLDDIVSRTGLGKRAVENALEELCSGVGLLQLAVCAPGPAYLPNDYGDFVVACMDAAVRDAVLPNK